MHSPSSYSTQLLRSIRRRQRHHDGYWFHCLGQTELTNTDSEKTSIVWDWHNIRLFNIQVRPNTINIWWKDMFWLPMCIWGQAEVELFRQICSYYMTVLLYILFCVWQLEVFNMAQDQRVAFWFTKPNFRDKFDDTPI